MLTADELLSRASAQPPAQPQVVYAPQPRRQFSGFLLIIALAAALGYGYLSGNIGIKPVTDTQPPRATIVTVSTSAPAWTLPTANIVAQPVAQPAVQPVVVVPQGIRLPTATAEPPTAVPTALPPAQQAVYDSLFLSPTPIPLPSCEASNETYITSPVRVEALHGFPIGEVRGRSCISAEDAHNQATALAQAMMDADKVNHPEHWK